MCVTEKQGGICRYVYLPLSNDQWLKQLDFNYFNSFMVNIFPSASLNPLEKGRLWINGNKQNV